MEDALSSAEEGRREVLERPHEARQILGETDDPVAPLDRAFRLRDRLPTGPPTAETKSVCVCVGGWVGGCVVCARECVCTCTSPPRPTPNWVSYSRDEERVCVCVRVCACVRALRLRDRLPTRPPEAETKNVRVVCVCVCACVRACT